MDPAARCLLQGHVPASAISAGYACHCAGVYSIPSWGRVARCHYEQRHRYLRLGTADLLCHICSTCHLKHLHVVLVAICTVYCHPTRHDSHEGLKGCPRTSSLPAGPNFPQATLAACLAANVCSGHHVAGHYL